MPRTLTRLRYNPRANGIDADVTRLTDAAKEHGYELPEDQAKEVWSQYSRDHNGTWLPSIHLNSDQLWELIETYTLWDRS